MRRWASMVVVLACVLGTAASSTFARGHEIVPTRRRASEFGGVPYVGAIFGGGLGVRHTCSASVVMARRGGLVLTAAHCISGTGAGLLFAPGYADGRAPYGVWTVTRAWVSPTWKKNQDPRADYAFLQVASRLEGGVHVRLQTVTGGAQLGTTPRTGTTVTVAAYNPLDEPITCTAPLRRRAGYPGFRCQGYPGGTSGGPFLTQGPSAAQVVVGVIGGLRQGGCTDFRSFSSPFDAQTMATFQRAQSRAPSDTVPVAGSSGC